MSIEIKNISHYNSLQDKYILIDFYTDWCIACKKIIPKLDILMSNYDIKLLKVNIDNIPELGDKYNIKSIPTFILLKNGHEKKRVIGADINKIKAMLDGL